MREIKFRAWDKEENKVVYQHDDYCFNFSRLNWSITQYFNDDQDKTVTKHSGFYELMQFTGLLDKNGKEIYEGDVLAVDSGRVKGAGVFTVEWHKGGFKMVWSLNGQGEAFQGDSKYLEVIGNIYENPHLLTPTR